MDSLRLAVPLAISALHGDCLDVPRGLRPRRLPGIASGRRHKSPFSGLANSAAALGVNAFKPASAHVRPFEGSLLRRGPASEWWFFLLRSGVCAQEVQIGGPPAAGSIHYLSSTAICAGGRSKGLDTRTFGDATGLHSRAKAG